MVKVFLPDSQLKWSGKVLPQTPDSDPDPSVSFIRLATIFSEGMGAEPKSAHQGLSHSFCWNC